MKQLTSGYTAMTGRASGWVAILMCAGLSASHAQDVARMDQLVRGYADASQFMGTVLVARDDKIVIDKGYGMANLEWDIPNTSSAKYRLGSVTKQFTAACVLLLEERGKLSLSDPIGKFVDDAPSAWSGVTLTHLLSHTSGIPNFTSFPEYRSTQHAAAAPIDIINRFRDKPLEFAPGEKMAYSNSGYLLLGYVIEKVSGETYAKFVNDNIFKPLRMHDSGYDSNESIIEQRASGYTKQGETIVNTDYLHMSIPHAAGALYSTTHDLWRWQRGLYGGKLLSQRSLEKMTTAIKNNYALGVTVKDQDGRKVIAHGGGINGFNTYLAYYPETRTTVVALANLNGVAPQEIVNELGVLAHEERATLAPVD